jgi:hypothetical protein
VKADKQGDTTWYWCWWDYKETKLNQHLEKLMVKAWAGDPQQKKSKDRLLSFFKNLYFTPVAGLNASPVESLKNIPPPYLNLYSSIFVLHNSPPPWS